MAKLSAIEICSPGLHTSHFDTSKVEFILSGNDKLRRRFWNVNIYSAYKTVPTRKTERWKKGEHLVTVFSANTYAIYTSFNVW